MRFITFFTAVLLMAAPQFTLAQNAANPADCNPDQTNCNPAKFPDEQVNLPPAGDVQNLFFFIAPVLGAAGLAAIAGGGNSTNSTTSTTN